MSRSQLDRLGDRLAAGSVSRKDFVELAAFRNNFIENTNVVAHKVAVRATVFKTEISQRPAKSTPSIIAKLRRESVRLTQIQDIGGVRIVVSKISVQDRVVRLLQKLYPDARVIDRRDKPQYGYRAVHVVVREGGRYVEAQVRTRMQNAWAQLSEKLADTHGQDIKYGGGPENIRDYLERLSRLGAAVEKAEKAIDLFKKSTVNALYQAKRGGTLSAADKQRLKHYRASLYEKRNSKAAVLRFLSSEMDS